MADYRFSAQIIKRSEGKSSIASAAYRSASRLIDQRTGEIHDYTRKAGVIHTEILSPDKTPEWMHDRGQLWNTVETVERRGDAQLAREIQLSLPHELDQAQRHALLLDFVQEQFVNQGMIADIAIHAPDAEGDQRNHHAHVMLTMRSLTGNGFGKKDRSWNSNDILAQWREQWAHHQNRALERHGHPARVDHRSFEARGIDREPSQHLGPVANDMERKGKASRIGNENRQIAKDNADRTMDHIAAVRVASQLSRFDSWANEKAVELEAAQDLTRLDLDQKHHRQKQALEARLNDDYGQAKATIKAEVQTIDRRLAAKGVRKILRDVFGRNRTDREARSDMAKTLRNIETREAERKAELGSSQERDRRQLDRQQNDRRLAQSRGIENARERALREAQDRAFRKATRPDNQPKAPEPLRSVSPAPQEQPEPPAEPSDKLGLDDKKRALDSWMPDGDKRTTDKPASPFRRSGESERRESPFGRGNDEGPERTPHSDSPKGRPK